MSANCRGSGLSAGFLSSVCGDPLVLPADSACRTALRKLDLRHSALSEEAANLAGRIFRQYRKEGGPRITILPDFLVAAHASTQADSLATDDRGYLRVYFPQIRILSPK